MKKVKYLLWLNIPQKYDKILANKYKDVIKITYDEIIISIINIIISCLGLLLIIFGWIVPYQQEKKKITLQNEQNIELSKIKWRKEQIDLQISELYGPVYAIIIENDVLFSRILYQLGRKYIIPKDKSFYDLPIEEQTIWKHYVDNYKIPNQMKIVSILRKNIHLIYKSYVPKCYNQFIIVIIIRWNLIII